MINCGQGFNVSLWLVARMPLGLLTLFIACILPSTALIRDMHPAIPLSAGGDPVRWSDYVWLPDSWILYYPSLLPILTVYSVSAN